MMNKNLQFRKGKGPYKAIVTDGSWPAWHMKTGRAGPSETDADHEKWLNDAYGGRLVCETVDPEFGALLESAPDLYRACAAIIAAGISRTSVRELWSDIEAALAECRAALALADADA